MLPDFIIDKFMSHMKTCDKGEHLNALRSRYNQATCGINNHIIQLINDKEYKLALYCHDKIKPYNIIYNKYFNNKIKHAKSMVNL